MVCVGMAGHIAGAPRVVILEPRSTNISILLVDHIVHVLAVFLDIIRAQNASNTCTYCNHLDPSVLRIVESNVRDGRELGGAAVKQRRIHHFATIMKILVKVSWEGSSGVDEI